MNDAQNEIMNFLDGFNAKEQEDAPTTERKHSISYALILSNILSAGFILLSLVFLGCVIYFLFIISWDTIGAVISYFQGSGWAGQNQYTIAYIAWVLIVFWPKD